MSFAATRSAFAALSLFAAAQAGPAGAQTVEARYDQVAAAIEEVGYAIALEGEGADRYLLSETEDEYTFAVLFYGCDDAGDACKTVQFYAGFEPPAAPSLRQMNDYAAANRWGRIYLDDEGDPAIEMDVDLEDGGMSFELFKDNVEYWGAVMNAFGDWVFDNAEAGEPSDGA